MLVEYIKELLYEHDCVVLPGFGGFIARYEGATIHTLKHSLLPPRKKLAFNSSLKVSDGLLENTISRKEGISLDEVTVELKSFVAEIEDGIEEIGHYQIAGIGKFFYNEEYSIQFEADAKENFLEESYALPELYFKPIEREEHEMAKVPPRPRPVVRRPAGQPGTPPPRPPRPAAKQKRPSKPPKEKKEKKDRPEHKKPIYVILPVIFIIFGVVGSILFKPQPGSENASLNPLDSTSTNEEVVSNSTPESESTSEEATSTIEEENPETSTVAADSEEPTSEISNTEEVVTTTEVTEEVEEEVVEAAPEPEPTPIEETTITEPNGRFHIIAGSFSSRQNAEKKIRQLGEGTILEPRGSSSLIKVSVKSYNSWSEANSAVESLRGTYGQGIWVYKH